ncbi:hypothetical protein EGR_08635 [Echinococcus granulosus]|uniref:Uncharacterized protein n=1 Tax=Echinococcus granulosus TaxID=6210 RepID=W6U5S0_ECHGR|nr:hypothetical protein EGR_08635 [Echinococcus granulosus]EUB56513.1 hypothetical protein EGR_08635 [Echinococcus granulosus]
MRKGLLYTLATSVWLRKGLETLKRGTEFATATIELV